METVPKVEKNYGSLITTSDHVEYLRGHGDQRKKLYLIYNYNVENKNIKEGKQH